LRSQDSRRFGPSAIISRGFITFNPVPNGAAMFLNLLRIIMIAFPCLQAFALNEILKRLGFETRPVQSVRCRFADGRIGGHAWVEVRLMGETRYVDALLKDPLNGTLTFEPVARVTGFSGLFRTLSSWGSSIVNAYVYFSTGSDATRYR
jgi:hypothetical protein